MGPDEGRKQGKRVYGVKTLGMGSDRHTDARIGGADGGLGEQARP